VPAIPTTRKIKTDNVPALSLGLMGISIAYGRVATGSVSRSVLPTIPPEDGWTFWDSADIYGNSEDFVETWYICFVAFHTLLY
ncbi:hypothetical protein P691DRAFT_686163, partial [Macrolepiota fuliginosa MF-IS2]